MKVIFYATPSGREPVMEYVEGLDARDRGTIGAAFRHLATEGLYGLDVKPIRAKLWELRITRHRVFYVVVVGSTMVLLHAYKKQSMRAPVREIATAERRMREVLAAFRDEVKP